MDNNFLGALKLILVEKINIHALIHPDFFFKDSYETEKPELLITIMSPPSM